MEELIEDLTKSVQIEIMNRGRSQNLGQNLFFFVNRNIEKIKIPVLILLQ